MKVLITGGAGFVGSRLALAFREKDPSAQVVAFDNLRRRGSEFNLPSFQERGIQFVHGDIRSPADLESIPGSFDLIIEASAEPSVHAGTRESPRYLLDTNLAGTWNCLEWARERAECLIFLSTSRVYSIAPLRAIRLDEAPTRFEIAREQSLPGVTADGISEAFPTHQARSLYGASKLASELIIQEYVATYGMKAVINRCGVIAGAGQFGKADQGIFTLWVANHYFGRPLKYTGFGGGGKQVRDLLHPSDLFALIQSQLERIDRCSGSVVNVGGGHASSTSLLDLTGICREVVGRETPVAQDDTTSAMDVPLYITDHRRCTELFDWEPRASARDIVRDISIWLKQNEAQLASLFA